MQLPCKFTDFELTDSRDAERLDRFARTADEIRIADRGFGSRPECIRSLAFGEADYIVRVHWRGFRWLTTEGMRFDMMGFLRGLDCGKNDETTVMIGNAGNKKAGVPFPARLIAVSLPPEKALINKTRLLSENRRKGRVVQAETPEAAGHYRKMNIQQRKWLIVTVCDGKLNWLLSGSKVCCTWMHCVQRNLNSRKRGYLLIYSPHF